MGLGWVCFVKERKRAERSGLGGAEYLALRKGFGNWSP